MFPDLTLLRSRAIAIAAEYAEPLSKKEKARLLRCLDTVFERWKTEQADSDGLIEVGSLPLPGGLGYTLAELARHTPRRIHSTKLRPEQCAGPLVTSRADLFGKLIYEKATALQHLPSAIPYDLALAVLVEDDGNAMAGDSLILAVHLIWSAMFARADAYRELLGDEAAKNAAHEAAQHSRQKHAAAHLTLMRDRSAQSRRALVAKRDGMLRASAAKEFRKRPGATVNDVAKGIYDAAKRTGWEGFERLTLSGVKRIIKGTKARAFQSVATD